MTDLFEDPVDEEEEAFDEGTIMSARHTVYDSRVYDAIGAAGARIADVTTNQFAADIYQAATFLKNVLGDADPVVAAKTDEIRSNTLVILTEINKDPAEFIISMSRAFRDPEYPDVPTKEEVEFATQALNKLQWYCTAVANEVHKNEALARINAERGVRDAEANPGN